MSMYLCLVCGEIYDSKFLQDGYYKYCPKPECAGSIELAEIDELMLYPIKIINEKGWSTKGCCSGHLYGNRCGGYVLFNPDFMPKIDPPVGWEWSDDSLHYNKKYNVSLSKNQKIIFKHIQSLLEWCEKLPYNPEFFDEE